MNNRLYVFTRIQQRSVTTTDDADATIEFSFTDGWATIAGAGDVNGDGYADILVGHPLQAGGTVYLAYGPFQGHRDESAFAAVFEPRASTTKPGATSALRVTSTATVSTIC